MWLLFFLGEGKVDALSLEFNAFPSFLMMLIHLVESLNAGLLVRSCIKTPKAFTFRIQHKEQ